MELAQLPRKSIWNNRILITLWKLVLENSHIIKLQTIVTTASTKLLEIHITVIATTQFDSLCDERMSSSRVGQSQREKVK